MRALIVDDEPLARNELVYLLNHIGGFEVLNEAENVSETLEALLIEDYDLIFLDINLMDENGIELGHKIQKMKSPPAIIFATAHDQYAVQAFEVDATDYILKPFDEARIKQAIDKVIAKQRDSEEATDAPRVKVEQAIPVELSDRIHMINQADIIGLSVNHGMTTLFTTHGEYETTEPLNAYEKRLNPEHFLRIHRAHIVNQAHIIAVEHWFNYTFMLTLTNDVKMQVSRSYMKDFKAQLGLN
ncbi:response regulator transcription factor LytR [Staphylococcus massiliensis]|uniref:Two-component response regulator n=1 Tax=Staphylococcus massiliensis S46 TaxID=1229783 RepID=K9ALF4_9STAP|nr:response regulator transcription factor LytR [Staphylococcus massiliensis]EKU48129.1 two-component response regulator [Staphylococcus massiliensis S46]MCG3399608.1 response regulator transcription factor LytR [Staphylococcus massiliensis]MCG3402119.1 response regulator transcription factor LytR [Staphylococcus massiliensis]MCG3413311.1 response regulator transcription factor LytR [Staphylococcus massiliensis]PNZ99003.1 DNA-binding response regulator [Staphylococcus massiliensis CCUG 55927]